VQLRTAGVQQRPHLRQEPVHEVLRVQGALPAADEVLQVLQRPVPPPQHQVRPVRERRHGGDTDQQDQPERAGGQQEGGDEAGRGIDGHEETGGQQHLADVLGADRPAVDPDHEQDDGAHHQVDGRQDEVARRRDRETEPPVGRHDDVAEHQHGADVERVGRDVERDLHRRHAVHGERGRRGTEPRRDEQPRGAEQQPEEQRHAGQRERVRLASDLDPGLTELGQEEQHDERRHGGAERDAARQVQQGGGRHAPAEHHRPAEQDRGQRQRQRRGVQQSTDRPEPDGLGLRAVPCCALAHRPVSRSGPATPIGSRTPR
jgi:hypothetical protein